MRRKRWIKASLLTMIAAAPVGGMLTATDYAVAAGDSPSVQQLVDIIGSDNATSPQREDAAIQLIARNSTDADTSMIAILKTGNFNGQIAIARALAKAANPNPAFIQPLGNLLGTNHNLNEEASAALANCDGQPGVFEALKRFVDNPASANIDRADAIRAMGSVVQMPVASYLIDLLNAPNQSSTISNAATDALTELTGITTYGNNPAQWQQWWNGIKAKNADQFRSTVLITRDLRAKLFKQHEAQLVKAISGHLNESYQNLLNVNPKAAESTLLGYLNDPTPEIRFVGVDIIGTDFFNPKVATASVHGKLLKMIDDPDESVRLNVVGLLLNLNDPAALPQLIQRLGVEKNLQVKARLVQALGKLEDISAAPALIKLLDDPQPEIVTGAAKALASKLGTKLQEKDAKQADAAATKLRKIFNAIDTQPGTDDLKAACMAALAALKDKHAIDIFRSHVVPAQPAEVRRAALLGLGNLGDETTDETVAGQLQDDDATVRLKAAEALKSVATAAQLDIIVHRMKVDSDKSVQDALWIALSQKLYPKLKPDDLARIADDLNDDPNHTKDPDKSRRLFTLQKLGEAYAAAKMPQDVAQNQQVIADALMAVNPPRMEEAIDNLKQALEYWKGKGDRDKLEAIIEALLDDELKAKQWDIATKFASDQIKFDPAYQHTVGPKIKSKIDELVNGDHPDLDSAKTLIDDALKMDPKLDGKYTLQIQQLQDQLKAKAAAPPG